MLVLGTEDEVQAVRREDELSLQRELEGFAVHDTGLLAFLQVKVREDLASLHLPTERALDPILVVLIVSPALRDERLTGAVDLVTVNITSEALQHLFAAGQRGGIGGADAGLREGDSQLMHDAHREVRGIDTFIFLSHDGLTIVNGTILSDYASRGCIQTPSICRARYE